MSDPNGHFAAELDDLMKVGTVDLMSMAATYATLNRQVDRTESADHDCFAYDSGGLSPVAGPWTRLRDDLVNVLDE